MNRNPLDFCFKNVSYLSEIQKQTANSLVTETLQYFVFFYRSAYFAILAKCLIINGLRLILAILFLTAFLNITHLARHTFATTTTLAKGVPIETVSKMLGHTNIETTQIYARITNSKISNDMKGLTGKFAGVEKIYEETNC